MAHADDCVLVECLEAGLDIDTPEDYQAALQA